MIDPLPRRRAAKRIGAIRATRGAIREEANLRADRVGTPKVIGPDGARAGGGPPA
jgi:hypothetical protein